MKYVFGGVFICEGKVEAEQVAFGKHGGYRAITLDGDIFDPKGSVMGGYNESRLFFQAANDILEVKRKMAILNKELDAIKVFTEEIAKREHAKNEKEAQKAMLTHRLKLVEQEESARAEGSFETQLAQLNQEIDSEATALKTAKQQIIREEKELEELHKFIKEGDSGNAEKLKKAIDDVGREINQYKKEIEKATKEENRKKINIEKCDNDLLKAEATLSECKTRIETLAETLNEFKAKKTSIDIRLNTAKAEVQVKEAVLVAADMKVKELAEARDELERLIEVQQGELKQIDVLVQANISEQEQNMKLIKVLEAENPFIEVEKEKFGTAGTEYDFAKISIKELSDKSGKLQKDMDKLKKMININIDEIGDTIEKQYETLLQRKEIVIKDKKRLEETMNQLDKKKKDALMEVWKKVNFDFGDIFKTLLPHARSRLELINANDITEGIEFKVSFNGIDKESLNELSGGQRTLIALSFIFALLKYKPAPLYILDEIDAALDISHTQNIGIMIKEKFPQSQFLVVSLKDGMFNNANVLFKVAFVDGCSRVTRVALRESSE